MRADCLEGRLKAVGPVALEHEARDIDAIIFGIIPRKLIKGIEVFLQEVDVKEAVALMAKLEDISPRLAVKWLRAECAHRKSKWLCLLRAFLPPFGKRLRIMGRDCSHA